MSIQRTYKAFYSFYLRRYISLRKGISYAALVVVLSSFMLSDQSDFNYLIKTKLDNYRTHNWPEKIYVQTDKSLYTSNETIWFSAYLVNGVTHLKSTKSKVIHVEVINDRDSIIDKHQLFIEGINTSGDFKINDNWTNGKYTLRAYTNYMRNQSADYFFKKEIRIWSDETDKSIYDEASKVNSVDASTAQKIISSNEPDLNFYPEAGHLIENLSSKVAFKIKNEFYHAGVVSGYITDNDGQLVSHFQTFELGMGIFFITPRENKTYFATIEINGSEYQYQLPKALPEGYNLTATYRTDDLSIDINSSTEKDLLGSYLIIHQRGEIIFEEVLKEKKNRHSLKLSSDKLQDGVLHITLFNKEGHPVCERLIFIESEKNNGTIKINKNKNTFNTREKMDVILQAEDYTKAPLLSSLSISVKKSDFEKYTNHSENIKTWLLLNSDLRGAIKNPKYLFSKTDVFKRKYLLDLVMMTNGWRRFTWQNLIQDNFEEEKFTVEKGIVISGSTKLLAKPYSLTSAYTSLTLLGSEISSFPLQKSGPDGKFSFGPLEFYDSIPVFIQARLNNFASKDEKDRQVSISIDNTISSPKIEKRSKVTEKRNDSLNYLKISKYLTELSFQYNNSQKLDEVVLIGKNKAKEDARKKEMNELAIYGYPSYRLDIQSSPFFNSISMSDLLNQIPGLFFSPGSGFTIRGSKKQPRIQIDNTDASLEELLDLFPIDVSFIDYHRGASSGIFSNSANGTILVYTRQGKFGFSSNAKRKPGIINYNAEGFYTAKEFYSPNYSIERKNNDSPDIRTSLYWNAKVRTTAENIAPKVSFFTGDLKGEYIIEVEGISDSGIPLYQTSKFVVE